MSIRSHWHAVLRGADLAKAPVATRLAGQEIVLFRTENGAVAALDDYCPHRRMRLSMGKVCDGHLQCAYHGWRFATDGSGESPGTPKLHASTTSHDTCEAYGLIWVRARGSSQPMPVIDVGNAYLAALVEHRIRAPLELVVDNFTEIEHTATVHKLIGFPLSRMHEVTVRFESDANEVRSYNSGPGKLPPLPLRAILGVGRGCLFHSNWITRFSPVWSLTEHYWSSPRTGRTSWVRWKLVHIFTPLDDQETQLWTLSYIDSAWPLPYGGAPVLAWYMRAKLREEIDEDKRMLEGLAVADVRLEGMKLSRFDRGLGLNRERIARVYRGEAPGGNGTCAKPVRMAVLH